MATMTPSDLTTLKQPLAIRTDCITPQPTTLHVKHDLSWSNGDYTVTKADGSVLLSCDGKGWSNSMRTQFRDASGLPLFDLRISWFSISKTWRLELPGDHGQMVMAVRLRWTFGKLKLDCTFTNAASDDDGGGQEVTLKVRGQDMQNFVTDITCGETKVASVRRVFESGKRGAFWMFKQEYDVVVAGGMDMALVSCLLVLILPRRGERPREYSSC